MKVTSVFKMLTKPLSRAYPHTWFAIFFLSIAICELLFLTGHNNSFWYNSHLVWYEYIALVSLSILTWASAGWFFWWFTQITRYQIPWSVGRWISVAVRSVFFMALLFFYSSSWIFYWRTGSFLDADALVFGTSNLHMIAHYIWQAERASFLMTSAICLIGLLLGIYIFRRLPHSPDPMSKNSSSLWIGFLTIFLTFDLTCMIIFAGSNSDSELQSRLNPLLTVTMKTFLKERESNFIQGELSERELGPKRATPYEVNQAQVNSTDRYSVIFIAIEALRSDVVLLRHQEREIMPHLNQLARSGQHFTRCYAQSTHSDYADPCLFSSLYPLRTQSHHYYSRSDPWPKVMLYDVLKQHGYATAIYSSQNESWGHMAAILESPKLDVFFDSRSYDGPTHIPEKDGGFAQFAKAAHIAGKLDDAITMQHAIDWIGEQQIKKKPFVLCMNLQTSHFPYEIPGKRPGPFQPGTLDFSASFVSYPEEKIPIVRNAYYNSLHYIDEQIGKLVSFLEKNQLREKTILVIAGDQGEAFYENGHPTHAGPPYEPVIRVALIMNNLNLLSSQQENYLTQAIDIVPTICGLLEIPPHPCFQGIDVLSNERPPVNRRLAFVHCQSSLSECEAVINGNGWKFVHDRQTGKIRLHNLNADPGEQTDLTKSQPEISEIMSNLLLKWRKQQILYYKTPGYYGWYYPPRTPELSKGRKIDLKKSTLAD